MTFKWRLAASIPTVVLTAVLAVVSWPVPASAALTASLQDLALPAVPYSHSVQTTSGRAVLTATDSSLAMTGSGWHVSEQASDLVYSGPNEGTSIPAMNLAIVSVEDPVAATELDQSVSATGGPRAPSPAPVGSLDAARVVLQADPEYGSGTYTQGMVLSLTIPPRTRAGTYTATITTTISSGP